MLTTNYHNFYHQCLYRRHLRVWQLWFFLQERYPTFKPLWLATQVYHLDIRILSNNIDLSAFRTAFELKISKTLLSKKSIWSNSLNICFFTERVPVCISQSLTFSRLWSPTNLLPRAPFDHIYGLVRSKREYYHNCSLVVFLCSFL